MSLQTFKIEFLKINGEIEVLPNICIQLADDVSIKTKQSGHIEPNGDRHHMIDSITISMNGVSQSEALVKAKNRLYQILSYISAKSGCKLAVSKPIEYQFHYQNRRRTLPSQDLQLFHRSYLIRECLTKSFRMDEYECLSSHLKHALHFYQAAMDDTNPDDYRLLNFWRFFEAFSDTGNKEKIINNILNVHMAISSSSNYATDYPNVINKSSLKEILETVHDTYRCPIAHFRSSVPGILPNFNDARIVGNEYISKIRIILMFLEDLTRTIVKRIFEN